MRAHRILVGSIAKLTLFLSVAAAPVFAQCGGFGAPSTQWQGGGSGAWETAGNWTSGTPTSSTNVCITPLSSAGVTLSTTGAFANLLINPANSLSLADGAVMGVSGTQVVNAGDLSLNGNLHNTDLVLNGSGTLTLTGPGTLSLNNSFNNRIYAGSLSQPTLTNQLTIQGAGQIGINDSNSAFNLTNLGTIVANSSGQTLQVAPTNAVINVGTMAAANGGRLALIGTVNNEGLTPLIQATGVGSIVDFTGSTINNGALTTIGGGVIQNNGTATLNSVTITSGSTVNLNDGSTTTLFPSTLTNNGTINLNSTGTRTQVQLIASLTLTGTGTLTLSNNANNLISASSGVVLTNDTNHTIQGSGIIGIPDTIVGNPYDLTNKGTIDANQSTPLRISVIGTVTNTGLMEATAGATLLLTSGLGFETVNNAGGTILASGAGSVVQLAGGSGGGSLTINGGTLTGMNGGVIVNQTLYSQPSNVILNGVTISSGTSLTLADLSRTTLQGTIVNNGAISTIDTNFNEVDVMGTVTVNGSGSLTMGNGNGNRIVGFGSDTLINGANHTIQGGGSIGVGNAGLTLINNGTILADGGIPNPMTVASTSLTNNGTLQANAGSTLHVTTALTNFSGGTLTGGSYVVFGGNGTPGTIQVDVFGTTGGEILTNAATIALNGLNSNFVDANQNDVLTALSSSSGSFSILGGRNFSSPAATFTNSGTVDIGPPDDFSVNGGAGGYTQTAGTTEDDGSLSVSTVTLNGGTFEGIGTVGSGTVSFVNNGGTVKPGDSPGTLTINGNYTQGAAGTLQIDVGGLTPGTGYGVLTITGDATLDGILKFVAVNGFNMPGGITDFFVVNYAGRTGKFSSLDVSGLNLISGYSENVFYDQGVDFNQVEVQFVSPEPATYSLLTAAFLLAIGWRLSIFRRRAGDGR